MAETVKTKVAKAETAEPAQDTAVVGLAEMMAKIAELQAENAILKKQETGKKGSAVDDAARRMIPPPSLDNQPKVPVTLFYDGDKYADDVFVGVNGIGYQIRRGETVEVPEAVAEVLENANQQSLAAARFMREKREEYEKNRQPGT